MRGAHAKKMTRENLPEQLFVSVVGMDPILDGFSGVLVENYRERDASGRVHYVLLETTSATGNRLVRFTSTGPSLVASILLEDIGCIRVSKRPRCDFSVRSNNPKNPAVYSLSPYMMVTEVSNRG